jgi:hypothetical protein
MLLAVRPLGRQLSLNSGSATSVGASRKSAQRALYTPGSVSISSVGSAHGSVTGPCTVASRTR